MIERARSFGTTARLAGVITEPTADAAGGRRPDVVVWNAGLLHHVGPNRLFVDMARSLASYGFATLRFDLSGIGDSSSGAGDQFSEQRAVAEVREAMDYLASSRKTESFVLVGLCSGAVDAHYATLDDDRVRGAVMLDGYGYRTGAYYVHYYKSRILSLRRWLRWPVRLLGKVWGHRGARGATEQIGALNFRRFPSRREAKAQIGEIVARGVELFYVYTGGVEDYFNHPGQFRRMFPGIDLDRIQVVHLPDADHLYTMTETRRALIQSIGDWMRTKFQEGSE